LRTIPQVGLYPPHMRYIHAGMHRACFALLPTHACPCARALSPSLAAAQSWRQGSVCQTPQHNARPWRRRQDSNPRSSRHALALVCPRQGMVPSAVATSGNPLWWGCGFESWGKVINTTKTIYSYP
jgi:hypothetical protein